MMETETPSAKQLVVAVVIAGLVGEVVFELYAMLISPALFGAALQPANLVRAIYGMLTGGTLSYQAAFVVHFLIGSLGFGVFVLLVRQLMPERVAATGILAGLVLWFVAQGILAPVIGRPFMMEFGAYTQSSFIGHVGMTLIMSCVLAWLLSPARGVRAVASPPGPV